MSNLKSSVTSRDSLVSSQKTTGFARARLRSRAGSKKGAGALLLHSDVFVFAASMQQTVTVTTRTHPRDGTLLKKTPTGCKRRMNTAELLDRLLRVYRTGGEWSPKKDTTILDYGPKRTYSTAFFVSWQIKLHKTQ